MSTHPKPTYRRILLKLSGEALMGDEPFGIDAKVLDRMAQRSKAGWLGVRLDLSSVVVIYSVAKAWQKPE